MPKAAAPSTPASRAEPGPHEETPLDYLGAAVEPVLSAGSSMIAAPVGGAVRLISAAMGNNYAGAQQAGNNVADALTYKPQTQGGQEAQNGLASAMKGIGSAVMASPVGPAISAVGSAYDKTFVQGAPNALMATINSMVPSATTAIVLPAAGKLAGSVVDGTVANKLRTAVSGAPAIEPGSIPFGVDSRPKPAAASSNPLADAAAPKPNYRPNGDGTFTEAPPAPGRTAAPQASAPPAGTSTSTSQAPPAATATAASTPPPTPTFEAPEIPTPKTTLSPEEQQANIDAMKAIGLDAQRASAIGGDKFMAGTEFQQSKLNTAQGEVMREQLAKEQGAVKNFAQSIVQDTGATSATPEAVGQAIRAPLQGLSQHYDDAIGSLYKTADQRAAGAPSVEPTTFGALLSRDSVFQGKAENNQLRRGVLAYAREQNLIGGDGTLQPMTVRTAEGMRQYLNSQWSPQNSGLIGKIKESLDTDVAKAGGNDIYRQARALHAERKNTLDNPNGISSLLNENGPNGINQSVPDERVAPKMLAMPTNQFAHVIDTLNSLPPELAPHGQQAIAEVKGALAQKIYKAGDSGGTQNGPSAWNAANVTKALNANASKMARVFTPEEIAKFQALNRAGHILLTPSAYPGAAVQGHNLAVKGLLYAPSMIGGAIGDHLGGYLGTLGGQTLGNALSRKLVEAAEQRSANKLQEMLNNPRVIRAKR